MNADFPSLEILAALVASEWGGPSAEDYERALTLVRFLVENKKRLTAIR